MMRFWSVVFQMAAYLFGGFCGYCCTVATRPGIGLYWSAGVGCLVSFAVASGFTFGSAWFRLHADLEEGRKCR